jgi:hypothetical protein
MSEPVKVKGIGLLNAISFASTLIQANEYTKLKALEEQGQNDEFNKMFLSYLKNAIFKIKSTAEDAVSESKSNPEYSSAVLKLLLAKLDNSAVKIENFEDISDKEYASNAIKFMKENEAEISSKLTTDGKEKVQGVINSYNSWSDLKYYIDNINEFNSYKEAIKKSSSAVGCVGPIIIFLLGIVSVFLALFAMFKDNTNILPGCLALFLIFGSIIWWAIANGNKKKAKNSVKEFESFFDEVKLKNIDNTYQSSFSGIQDKLKLLQENIISLIGKMPNI